MSFLEKTPSYAGVLVTSLPVQFWYFAGGYVVLRFTRWAYRKVAR